MRLFICVLLLIVTLAFPLAREVNSAPATSPVEQYLIQGKFKEGEAAMNAKLQKNPNDDNARFGLGVLQLMGGAEKLMQSLYRYGLQQNGITQFFSYFAFACAK